MARLAPALALAALLMGGSPAAAITPAGFDCPQDDGRESLTTDGFQLDFEAPAVAAPELAAANHPAATAQRSGIFFFRANFAPYASGDLTFTLSWTDSSDFDLYVFDAEGSTMAVSNASNIDGGDTRVEEAVVEGMSHCTDFSVQARNWAGRPDQTLKLKIEFKNPGPAFACELDDPHPACAGKAEGEAPDRLPDTRTRLYLGGDRPGQASMVGHYVFGNAGAGEPPLKGTLSSTRPLGGKPNTHTRLLAGNPEQHENPFFANFSIPVEGPKQLKGTVDVLLWLSSQTMSQDGGPVHIDLMKDGTGALATDTRIARVDVAGSAIGTTPTPVRVRFTGLDAVVESELVLQISANPVATSGGAVGNPNDAELTLYYDSVQFPSRVTLDPLGPAPIG